jgi:hypothetical protein
MTEPQVPGPRFTRVTAGLGIGVWIALAAAVTFGLAAINHIDCGGDPASCEPAVRRAANIGLLAQGLVLATALALLARVRRGRLRSVLAVTFGVSIVVFLIAYILARSAVDAQ